MRTSTAQSSAQCSFSLLLSLVSSCFTFIVHLCSFSFFLYPYSASLPLSPSSTCSPSLLPLFTLATTPLASSSHSFLSSCPPSYPLERLPSSPITHDPALYYHVLRTLCLFLSPRIHHFLPLTSHARRFPRPSFPLPFQGLPRRVCSPAVLAFPFLADTLPGPLNALT